MKALQPLQDLAEDLCGSLAGGAHAVAGDPRLRRHAGTLRALAKKVPALGPLADALDRVVSQSENTPVPVCGLLVLLRQARSAIAGGELAGKIEPVQRREPWHTSASPSEVHQLAEALRRGATGRLEMLTSLVEREQVADLRLLDPLLGALSDGHTELADLIAGRALPAFNASIAEELRSLYNVSGKALDVRRLTALVRLCPQEGLSLCREAWQQGSLPIRAQGLRLLPEFAKPDEVIEMAASVFVGKSKQELRQAAVKALGRLGPAGGQAAVDLLMRGVRDKD